MQKVQHYDINVDPGFFVPVTSMCTERPLCQRFQRLWQRYMSGFAHYGDPLQRIMLLVPVEEKQTLESVKHKARIISSVAVWLATDIPFIDELLKAFSKNDPKNGDRENIKAAISLWAVRNSFFDKTNGWGGRVLQHILHELKPGEDLRPLHQNETDLAEIFIVYLATADGIKLLRFFKRSSKKFFEPKRTPSKS